MRLGPSLHLVLGFLLLAADTVTAESDLLAADEQHSCAVRPDGKLLCWGYNQFGNLGDGTQLDRGLPVEPVGLPGGVVETASGGQHTCARTASGDVWCWGGNFEGEVGDGTTQMRLQPVLVLSDAVQITAGAVHTCALDSAGGVSCWGDNEFGQVGDDTNVDRSTPTPVFGLSTGVAKVAAGLNHTCVVTTQGGVQCWGFVGEAFPGAVGAPSPVPVPELTSGVVDLAAGGFHTCALRSSGVVSCWGDNGQGQLGDGTEVSSSTPVDVTGLVGTVTQISAGHSHTCAVVDGAAHCWGYNGNGRLGDGTTTPRSQPVPVSGLPTGIESIVAGSFHTCAVDSSHAVWCWGENALGQLGQGNAATRPTPGPVAGLPDVVTSLALADEHSCAVVEGEVFCWGNGDRLGNGYAEDSASAVLVTGLPAGVVRVGAGSLHTCVTDVLGDVWCWGFNGNGQLGDGTTTHRSEPVEVIVNPPRGFVDVAGGSRHTCATEEGSGAWCWGYNSFGQLGDGTEISRTTPGPVVGLSDELSSIVAGDDHTCALTTDGVVYCWGDGTWGQLGDGEGADSSVPVAVTGLPSDAIAIAAAGDHSCAVVSTGDVLCWGLNSDGQLGDGTTLRSDVPVFVSGLTGSAVGVAAGQGAVFSHSCAVLVGGDVACWGANARSQLGDGTATDALTPVATLGGGDAMTPIGAGGTHSCVATSGGGVDCWGYDYYGQAGGEGVDELHEPAQVLPEPLGVAGLAVGVALLGALRRSRRSGST